MTGFGPLGCRPWPHLPYGKPPCRVRQVGEGVSPALDALFILERSAGSSRAKSVQTVAKHPKSRRGGSGESIHDEVDLTIARGTRFESILLAYC